MITDPTYPYKPLLPVKVKILDKRASMLRASAGSAGVDLRAILEPGIESIVIPPLETRLISTGVAIWIENPSYAGLIMARSGQAKKGLAPANKVGLIDSDYQGPLMVALHNHSGEPREVSHGERIAQLVFIKVEEPAWHFVEDFESTTYRGEGGFGSTGHE